MLHLLVPASLLPSAIFYISSATKHQRFKTCHREKFAHVLHTCVLYSRTFACTYVKAMSCMRTRWFISSTIRLTAQLVATFSVVRISTPKNRDACWASGKCMLCWGALWRYERAVAAGLCWNLFTYLHHPTAMWRFPIYLTDELRSTFLFLRAKLMVYWRTWFLRWLRLSPVPSPPPIFYHVIMIVFYFLCILLLFSG